MNRVVVSDTTTLSNLLHINRINLLVDLYGEVVLPESVARELRELTSHQQAVESFLNQNWVIVKAVERTEYVRLLHKQLDFGEAEAVSLALEMSADLLIIDEKKGRSVAQSLGISVIGTLGILVQAKQLGMISAIKPVMEQLITDAGFWIHETLQKQILDAVGE